MVPFDRIGGTPDAVEHWPWPPNTNALLRRFRTDAVLCNPYYHLSRSDQSDGKYYDKFL